MSKPEIDYAGLEVFTQMSVEEAGPDRVAGHIFGQLHNLVHAAHKRSEYRLDALDHWLNVAAVDKTRECLDPSVTGEIVLIATILREMAEGAAEHADDLRADDATLMAEDADSRSAKYREAYEAIINLFDGVISK